MSESDIMIQITANVRGRAMRLVNRWRWFCFGDGMPHGDGATLDQNIQFLVHSWFYAIPFLLPVVIAVGLLIEWLR